MNYIMTFWVLVITTFSWDPKASWAANVTIIFFTLLILGLVHWVPFWLIFLK